MNDVQIGIIGGSGLYAMEGMKVLYERTVDTPFGAPSDPYVPSANVRQLRESQTIAVAQRAAALRAARANVERQREPRDLLLLARSAAAAPSYQTSEPATTTGRSARVSSAATCSGSPAARTPQAVAGRTSAAGWCGTDMRGP